MENKVLQMLWTTVFLASCTNQLIYSPSPTSLIPVLPATTKLTITLTPMQVLTATPESRFTQQCLPIDDRQVELSEVAAGTILVSWSDSNVPAPGDMLLALDDIRTKREYMLPSDSRKSLFVDLDISPNRNMLARLEWIYNEQNIMTENVVWVLNAQAKIVAKIAFDRTDLVTLNFTRFSGQRVKEFFDDWLRTQPGTGTPKLNVAGRYYKTLRCIQRYRSWLRPEFCTFGDGPIRF